MISPIKTIIFDIGGVITSTDFKAIYSGFAKRIGLSPLVVIDYHNKNLDAMLLGDISLEQFWSDMKKAGGNPAADYPNIWIEEGARYSTVNQELLAIIERLRKQYLVGILTNLTFSRELLDKQRNLYSHFDYAILSCEEHFKKPDLVFYERALKKASAAPCEAIFIDDQEKYITVAENIGIRGIQYKKVWRTELSEDFGDLGNSQLLNDLTKLGVVVD